MNQASSGSLRVGIACGLAAYGSWGLFPLYFKSVSHIAAPVVLANRAVWSVATLALLVLVLGRGRHLIARLRERRLVLMLAASSLLIGANWLTFIFAVAHGHVLQSSLGYFINPLVNVLLGMLLFGERLRPYQIASLCLAAAGVTLLACFVGEVPWLALVLALTFALYGAMRKSLPVDGLTGLTVETLLMLPFAVGYLGYLACSSSSQAADWHNVGLLALSGPITSIPLLFFGAAARRLRLTTLGILQYITPTLHFVLAVLVYREPFSPVQLVSFACIWTAIAFYTADSFRALRSAPPANATPLGYD